MISVEEAVARIVSALTPLESERVLIESAAGRVLAADTHAKADQPPFAQSMMDGYAVRSADSGTRRVIGSAPAGHPFAGTLGPGEALRLFTGSVVPDGADAVLAQEDAQRDGERVDFTETPFAGKFIRPRGLDFQAGVLLVPQGRRLTPRDLALLAAGDLAEVPVRRRPVIAYAATGDELSRPGQPRKPGGIVASSVYGLDAMITGWGGVPRDLGILPDEPEAIAALAKVECDLLITLGGASVGEHDLIQAALGPHGFSLDFWKIAMRPGKPLIFGHLGATPFLGLPGNPVSSMVCALLFLRPAIFAMLGVTAQTPFRKARLIGALKANDSRQDHLRAACEWREGDLWARPFRAQDSSMQKLFAEADALIVRKPHAPPAEDGSVVEILPLD
ncbi:MAG: molybdopterin molybdotransferase MoeA [Proteobacteria bacterium]|nr:molybdopterin molybdotransferase MoeA [Pseudomonadota bacterium]